MFSAILIQIYLRILLCFAVPRWRFLMVYNRLRISFIFYEFNLGKVGDWMNHFSEDLNKKIDDWIDDHFGNTDMNFNYNLY